MWRHAADTLGYRDEPDAGDLRTATDAELYAVRERWTREQAWAPEWVADELSTAFQAASRARQEVDFAAAQLQDLPQDAPERAWLETHLEQNTATAETYLARAETLEVVHQARAGWAEATAGAETADRAAAAELERRRLPSQRAVATPEQMELFDGYRPAPHTDQTAQTEQVSQGRGEAGPELAVVASGAAEADEVTWAERARDAAGAQFRRDLDTAHQQRLAEVDPGRELDPTAREAALVEDNMTRFVTGLRAEHGDRLDPEHTLSDEDLAHPRAAELAAARAERDQAAAAAGDGVDPDGVLDHGQREAVVWQREQERARNDQHPEPVQQPEPVEQPEPARGRGARRGRRPGPAGSAGPSGRGW